jgi:hypothetical protein
MDRVEGDACALVDRFSAVGSKDHSERQLHRLLWRDERRIRRAIRPVLRSAVAPEIVANRVSFYGGR